MSAVVLQSIHDDIESYLELGQTNIAQGWSLLEDLLVRHKLAYKCIIEPECVMVSPCNRAGAGVNPHGAHNLGLQILRQGCSFDELKRSVCVELSQNTVLRKAAVDYNEALVQNSHGLLSSLFGSERYMSLAGSHTVAFTRAAKRGIYMNDEVENLAAKDKVFQGMMSHGWEWLVITSIVAEKFPGIPALASQARNASQNIAKAATEIEVALRIVNSIQSSHSNATLTSDEVSQIINMVKVDRPVCHDYVEHIMSFVTRFGGGTEGTLMRWLSDFAMQHADDSRLGEEFWNAIANTKFKSISNTYLFIRTVVM